MLKTNTTNKSKQNAHALCTLLIKIGSISIMTYILLTQVFAVRICHSNDMYPNVKDGDLVIAIRSIVATCTYDDVIIYKTPNGERYGRIIALPGDEVYIDDAGLLLNGSSIYSNIPYMTSAPKNSHISYPVAIAPGEMFILGDLREQATDSRIYGSIPETEIVGKTLFICRHRGF